MGKFLSRLSLGPLIARFVIAKQQENSHIFGPGKSFLTLTLLTTGAPFFPSPYESELRFFLSFLSGSLLLLVEFGERSFLGRKRGRWEDSPVPVIKGPTEKRKGHEKERERETTWFVRCSLLDEGRKMVAEASRGNYSR